MGAGRREAIRAALEAERGFVRILGGYTVGLAGGTLLVNERVPLPRLNRVQSIRVAPTRITQFFEAALDHYFQRAIRPSFRVERPVPGHVRTALGRLGFRARRTPESWLIARGPRFRHGPPGRARRSRPEELEDSVALWATPPAPVELRRQIEVGGRHPNPGEALVAFRSDDDDGRIASTGLAYRRGLCLDLEAVATRPTLRGRGSATALVEGILRDPIARGARYVALRTEEPRLAGRLAHLGFVTVERATIFELGPSATLALPGGPTATGGPLWRPPRGP